MNLDSMWRTLIGAFGGTQDASYVELSDDSVRFKFGPLFDRTFLRADIASAEKRAMQWWDGWGWRSNLTGRIGLLGSHNGVVLLKLRKRSRAWGVFPCSSIAVSLQEPDAFIAALGLNGA
jgi:hypothetical protein